MGIGAVHPLAYCNISDRGLAALGSGEGTVLLKAYDVISSVALLEGPNHFHRFGGEVETTRCTGIGAQEMHMHMLEGGRPHPTSVSVGLHHIHTVSMADDSQ